MLQDIADLRNASEEQKGILVDFLMRGVIAYDLETEAELRRSMARRRTGRPAHYYVYAPSGRTSIHHLKSGWRRVKIPRKVFGLSAYTDTQAREKANDMFPKKFARFQESEYFPDTPSDVEKQVQAFAIEQVEKHYDPYWIKRGYVEILMSGKVEKRKEHNPSSTGVMWKMHLRYDSTQVIATVYDEQDRLTLISCEEEGISPSRLLDQGQDFTEEGHHR